MVAATDDQRHAPRNAHAVHGFPRRQLKTVLQRFRRGKRSRAGLRQLAIARLTRQHRTVCHKPNQVRVRHCTAQKQLVILQFRCCLERIDGCVHDGVVKRVQQILTDQTRRLTPENASAAGGQLDFYADLEGIVMLIDVVRIPTELSDSCSAQYLLTWGIDKQTAAIFLQSSH